MGFSTAQGGGNVTFMKIKGLEKAAPEHYFEVGGQQIEGNKFVGKLVSIEPSSYEYEGKEKQTIKMVFSDNEEKYQLDISYNSISRNLINSTLGYIKENIGDKELIFEMSLFMNKGGFKSLGLHINGKKTPWFYSIDEQRELIERIVNKKGELVSNDYSAYDEKLKEGIASIKKAIGSTSNKKVDEFAENDAFGVEDMPF